MAKNAIRQALINTPFRDWPYGLQEEAFDILRTIRGKKLLAEITAKKPGSMAKLVDMLLEERPSIDDL